jgi:hypothetical protein
MDLNGWAGRPYQDRAAEIMAALSFLPLTGQPVPLTLDEWTEALSLMIEAHALAEAATIVIQARDRAWARAGHRKAPPAPVPVILRDDQSGRAEGGAA